MIEKLSKLWAASIAYVMLLAGAGLSVAGNVADVFRTRGQAVDSLDIILAGAWPVLVILTIEGFVSRRWSPKVGFQVLRWAACLGVGSMAMMSSWVHLHDLMATRGQIAPVAIGGPLAIDGMAIMATGLLLSTRGRVPMSTPAVSTPAVAKWPSEPTAPSTAVAMSTDPFAEWESELDTMDFDLVATQPVSPAPRSNDVRPERVPADVAYLILAWQTAAVNERPTLKDMAELLAAHTGRSTRTIRRWKGAIQAA